MTIYKDVNGREFTYNEYWNKIYLDEKRPHVDHLIRHKWPEDRPEHLTWVLIRNKSHFGDTHNSVSWYVEDEGFYVSGFDEPFDGVTHWWNLPEVTE